MSLAVVLVEYPQALDSSVRSEANLLDFKATSHAVTPSSVTEDVDARDPGLTRGGTNSFFVRTGLEPLTRSRGKLHTLIVADVASADGDRQETRIPTHAHAPVARVEDSVLPLADVVLSVAHHCHRGLPGTLD